MKEFHTLYNETSECKEQVSSTTLSFELDEESVIEFKYNMIVEVQQVLKGLHSALF